MFNPSSGSDTLLIHHLQKTVHPLVGSASDYDPLLALIGDARFVLIGEASHGTHEFYRERALITRRLIAEKGFNLVVVEADWPDAYRVNRYVRGRGDAADPDAALGGFRRFPTWMWRNTIVREFVDWLRAYNAARPAPAQAGFYGLDLYSLYTSVDAVLRYLDRVDPEAARRARYRYGCFEHFGEDSQAYGYAAGFGLTAPCEDEVIAQLVELQRRAADYASRDGRVAADEFFAAEQNARLIKNAEEYYRTMFHGRVSSWNLRDRHMAGTLDALMAHLERQGDHPKAVIWAHNSHLGDARATQMGAAGELNLGQLVREQYGRAAVLIGFSTYQGTVTAASQWDAPAERKRVRPGLPGSYEALFHEVGLPRFLLPLRNGRRMIGDTRTPANGDGLHTPRLERAIGVIYLPQTERQSHYFHARLAEQFDALIHLDETQALEPLEPVAPWTSDEVPVTFPSAL